MSRVTETPPDAPDGVTIDRSIPRERWRYTCPQGCSDWLPTNNHILCRGCRNASMHANRDLSVEYYEIVDQKTGERIPWERVELVGQ